MLGKAWGKVVRSVVEACGAANAHQREGGVSAKALGGEWVVDSPTTESIDLGPVTVALVHSPSIAEIDYRVWIWVSAENDRKGNHLVAELRDAPDCADHREAAIGFAMRSLRSLRGSINVGGEMLGQHINRQW